MPAGHHLAIGKHDVEVWFGKEQSGHAPPKTGAVFVFDMFLDTGPVFVERSKGVGMNPMGGRAGLLRIGKTILADAGVDRGPVNRKRAKPERKF